MINSSKIEMFALSHPMFRVVWDATMMVAILVSAITIPYELVFGFGHFDLIYWSVTFLFSLDVLVHFKSSVQKGHLLLTARKEITYHYFKTWFAVDLISALPLLPLVSWLGVQDVAVLGVFHALRLIRTLRLLKMNSTLKHLELQINPSIIRLVVFFFWFMMLVHILALGWVNFSSPHFEMENIRRYLLALYWTITTIAGVGYGDIVPDKTSYVEICYTIGVELVGVGVFGYIIGNIASLVTNLDLTRANFRKKVEEIDTFFRVRRVPRHLHERVRNYYDYLWETRRSADSFMIINELPHTLRIEIAMFLNQDVIKKVSLFEKLSDEFIHELVLMLEPLVYLPGDFIIREGEFGDCMYFIASGEVEVTSKNVSVATLHSGSPFGESALISESRRNASVRSVGYCDVYRLSKKDFNKLRQRYPDFDKHVTSIVEERLKDTAEKTGV